MGKKQPKINNKKRRKTFNNPPSSKKSKKSNNYSKRNKKKFTYFSLKAVIVQRNHPKRNFLKIQASIKKDAKIFQYSQI